MTEKIDSISDITRRVEDEAVRLGKDSHLELSKMNSIKVIKNAVEKRAEAGLPPAKPSRQRGRCLKGSWRVIEKMALRPGAIPEGGLDGMPPEQVLSEVLGAHAHARADAPPRDRDRLAARHAHPAPLVL